MFSDLSFLELLNFLIIIILIMPWTFIIALGGYFYLAYKDKKNKNII